MAGKCFSPKTVVLFILCYAIQTLSSSKKEEARTQPSLALNNFGPVTTHLTNLTVCKGPKRKNCNEDTMKIETADKSTNRYKNTTFTFILRRPTLFARMKMSIWRIMDDGVSLSHVSKVLENPCSHFFLGPLLKKQLKFTGSRCVAAKGTYVGNHNCDQLVTEMVGFRFFYGTCRSEVHVVSTDCNVYCLALTFSLTPKVEDKRIEHKNALG